MSISIHHLAGCAPTPLAWYLKGLGILRLVAEQKDPQARGWWQDEAFHLATVLSAAQLEEFLLHEYAPTPILAPWNKGSGFVYPANNPSLAVIAESKAARLAAFRQAIDVARVPIVAMAEADAVIRAIKDEAKLLPATQRARLRNSPEYKKRLAEADRKFKELKGEIFPICRNTWRGPQQAWMDAALTLNAQAEASFPALLGSGGNDGKNDFTKQFMECLLRVLDPLSGRSAPVSRTWLCASLYGTAVPSSLAPLPIGQFLPGSAGGANMTAGTDADAAAGPWDYILLMEGVLNFVPATTRRVANRLPMASAAPFAIHPSACGYASATRGEEASRGEQWMPLWRQPCLLGDVQHLLAEGRAQLGRRCAGRPVEFARAVARLGVARGIDSFQRFGYLERNGQSNLAVPLGRWQVTPQPHQDLLDDLDAGGWQDRLQRAARDKHAPASLANVQQRLDDAVMAVCAHGGEKPRWQVLLLALAEVERQFLASGKFTAEKHLQPVPPLSPGWCEAADDGSPEFRLALALALQAADAGGRDPVRRHWLPLDERGWRFAADAAGLRHDPRVVCQGLDAERDLVALVQRRLIEGGRGAATRLPLVAVPGVHARFADVAALLAGQVDLARAVALARACMALDRRRLQDSRWRVGGPGAAVLPPPLYALFRLVCLPWPVRRGGADIRIPCDPEVVARLASGDLAGAADIALRRLRACGLVPLLRHVSGDAGLARRLAVSLAFPVSERDATRLVDFLTKPSPPNQTEE